MHLLRRDAEDGITLTQFSDDDQDLPRYAILSHTWGLDSEEVTFDDIQNKRGQEKEGYKKINFCGAQAEKDGIEYFWIDTCCINKASSAELSEAITRMFRWYQGADVCYVYLADVFVHHGDNNEGMDPDQVVRSWKPSFRRSRWFKRGWTLQELLAPEHVVFFSTNGDRLGTKSTLVAPIHEITDIPLDALQNQPLNQFPRKERMCWADGRATKKEEDQAYCLLGLLDVCMCIRYGEGKNAVRRLRSEIEWLQQNETSLTSKGEGKSHARMTVLKRKEDLQRKEELRQDEERLKEKRRKDLTQWLHFETMDLRRTTIQSAHSSSCKWFLDNPAYLEWMSLTERSRKYGFLWIVGKPGAGKSTLMKFIHAQAAGKQPEGEVIIPFFFNARGDMLEKSTLGMYRALLYELLHDSEDLQRVFDEVIPFPRYVNRSPDWTIELLCELLSAAIPKLGQRRLRLFIDALDECDEEQIRGAVAFFEKIGSSMTGRGASLHICFASRHYPTIDIRNGQKLILEDQDGHSKDLVGYVQSHLKVGKGERAEGIRTQLQERASGVFMWVVLVVTILNAEFRRGRIFAVRKRLSEIPDELSDLFRNIVNRDDVNRDDLLLCLQWIAFAGRPLNPEEFYYAMVTGLDPEPDNLIDPGQLDADDMKRFVINSSKGLAEVTKSRPPVVQFIHESVRDFLVKENGLKKIWHQHFDGRVDVSSHDRLKCCCYVYLSVSISTLRLLSNELPTRHSSNFPLDLKLMIGSEFPLLAYAAQNVFHHANEVAQEISQAGFLRDFPLDDWIYISNLFHPYIHYPYTTGVDLPYIFAENGYSRLIKTLGPQDLILNNQQELHQSPLFAAIANSHQDAVRTLLQFVESDQIEAIIAKLQFGEILSTYTGMTRGQTSLLWALQREDEALAELLSMTLGASDHKFRGAEASLLRMKVDSIEAEDGQGRTALVLAAHLGYKRVLQVLIDKGAEVNSQKGPHGTALQVASRNGHKEVVQILLDGGADSNARGGTFSNPLQAASHNGHEQVVQILLHYGADIHVQDGFLGNALQAASRNGHEHIARILLEQGIDINAQCGYLRNALQAAAYQGHEKVVQTLLDRGANINARGGRFNDALQAASNRGHKSIVQILIDRGADVDVQGGECGSALQAASKYGHGEIVQMLSSHGAKSEDLGIYMK